METNKTYVVREITRVPAIPTDDRKGIIGGSQIGVICNLDNCYSSEYRSYRSFMGYKDEVDESTKETFLCGHVLEDAIGKYFEKKTGFKVKEPDYMYVDPDDRALILHPDREFMVGNLRCAVECKTASSDAFRGVKWPEPVLLKNNERPSFIDPAIPLYSGSSVNPGYYAQCMWYYALAGYDYVFLVRLTDNKFYIYFVPCNIEKVQFFYNRTKMWKLAILNGYVPKAKTEEDVKLKYPKAEPGKILEAPKSLALLLEKFSYIHAKYSSYEKQEKALKTEIGELIGDNEVVNFNGEKIASYLNSSKSGINEKLLKSEMPDVYDKYYDPLKSQFRKLTSSVKTQRSLEEIEADIAALNEKKEVKEVKKEENAESVPA